MIKLVLKRIFALVGSALTPIVAIMYIIAGVQSVISVNNDVKNNFFAIIAFALFFGLAFGLTLFGGKVLFSFLNKEDDDQPFATLIMCYTVFQFVYNLFYICFWGGNASNWVLLIFSLAASLLLLIHILGIQTAWYTDVIGVGIGMITAITSACANALIVGQGLLVAASVIFAIVCFLVMAIFALYLLKDNFEKKSEDNLDE